MLCSGGLSPAMSGTSAATRSGQSVGKFPPIAVVLQPAEFVWPSAFAASRATMRLGHKWKSSRNGNSITSRVFLLQASPDIG